jgi:hypothetical protein
LVRSVAQWADILLFPVAMAYNFQPQGAAHVMASFTPETVKAFAADRQAMRGGGARMHHADGTGMYKSQLRRIASMLEHQAFLLGDTPCLADFSVYHSVWFTQVQVPMLAGILDATPVVKAWTARIAAFGQGSASKMSAEEALAVAKTAEPQPLLDDFFQDEHGIPLGSMVTVAAESFGTEPTTGTLVAATRTRYTLRREHERTGTVHVHFPRLGFIMKKADA